MTSPLERLVDTNPELEIWWDSSPLTFDSWVNDLISTEKDEDKRRVLQAELKILYNQERPEKSLLQGMTTNPPLCLKAIHSNVALWNDWTKKLQENFKGATSRELFWRLYTEVIERSASMAYPIFESSNYKRGFVSGQVDPRNMKDVAQIVKEALLLNSIRRNIMVKMPGTKEGIYGITLLTSLGVPTNATLCFTVPQLIAVAEAVKKGLQMAKEKGIDLTMWRSVATMVLGRFEDSGEFVQQARNLGFELSEEDRRWAGVAVFKHAYEIFIECGYETKLLAASMRVGPPLEGKQRVWHIEKLAGGRIVLSISPSATEAFIKSYADADVVSRIDEPVPKEVLEKLLRILYFKQAYCESSLTQDDFISYPAVVDMARDFAEATQKLQNYATGQGNSLA